MTHLPYSLEFKVGSLDHLSSVSPSKSGEGSFIATPSAFPNSLAAKEYAEPDDSARLLAQLGWVRAAGSTIER